VNSAFIGTALEAHLRAHQIDTVVVVGITTDHCVSSTVRMAANLGFTVIVVSDATATFERTGPDGDYHSAELMHRVALASLHDEYCHHPADQRGAGGIGGLGATRQALKPSVLPRR
jgi:nicotinamidase-related amidase